LCYWLFYQGVLRAEEPDRWYLISETELRSIEEYKNKSEAEKQTWLLQVQRLKAQAASLQRESETLNRQLSDQRGLNQGLRQSFNEYEAAQLTLLSMKNGEIAELKEQVAEQTLIAEQYKGRYFRLLMAIIALGLLVLFWVAYKVLKLFRIIPG
jgi:chromosome segregation ATPase